MCLWSRKGDQVILRDLRRRALIFGAVLLIVVGSGANATSPSDELNPLTNLKRNAIQFLDGLSERISSAIRETLSLMGGVCEVDAAAPTSRAHPSPRQALPFSFVRNQGQWDQSVFFRGERGGQRVVVEQDRITLQMTMDRSENSVTLCNVALDFVGSSADTTPIGVDEQSGKYNYLRGSRSKNWQSQVPGFARIVFPDMYPGVDVHLRESQGHTGGDNLGSLEYDLVLDPQADLDQVIVKFQGVESARIETNGDLIFQTAAGELRQPRPCTWYETASGGRELVECNFRLLDENHFGFTIPGRDESMKVVIDPGLIWSTYVGGADDEQCQDLVLTESGAVILVGETDSPDFPTTPGVITNTFMGQSDITVTCLHADGTGLFFSTLVGGARRDSAMVVALSSTDEIVIAGETNSDDFPLTAGALDTVRGENEGFVAVLSPDGSNVNYATFIGGTDDDRILGMAINNTGDIYVAGETYASDFPVSAGVVDDTFNEGTDVFVARISPDGNGVSDLIFSTFLGGAGYELANSLALDVAGRPVIVGTTFSNTFTTTPGAYETSYSGKGDGFLTILNTTGTTIDYSTLISSSGNDQAERVALHPSGDLIVAGTTSGSDFPTTAGVYQPAMSGSSDTFVLRMDPQGSGIGDLIWSSFLGGGYVEYVYDLALDSAGNINVGGQTRSVNFPTTPDAIEPDDFFEWDGFVSRLSEDGTQLLYSTMVGSDGWDVVCAIAVDGLESVYVSGQTTPSPNFSTTPGVHSQTRAGGVYEIYTRLIAVEQTVSLQLTPQNNSAAPGQKIFFDITAQNNTQSFQLVEAVLNLYNPDGSPFPDNPFLGPKVKNLPGGLDAGRLGRYRVPVTALPGFYTLRGEVTQAGHVVSVSSFVFEVTQ